MTPLCVQISFGKPEEAKWMARELVERRLAACVHLIPFAESIYRWEGKIVSDQESLLSIKTTEEKWGELVDFVKLNHSYQCPEIVAWKPSKIDTKYLDWWNESLESDLKVNKGSVCG